MAPPVAGSSAAASPPDDRPVGVPPAEPLNGEAFPAAAGETSPCIPRVPPPEEWEGTSAEVAAGDGRARTVEDAEAGDDAGATPRDDYAIPWELLAGSVSQEEVVAEPPLDDGPYELGVLGFVSGREGNYWVLTACRWVDEAWTLGDTYLVDVRHPHAARLWEGRVVSVRGLDGGTSDGRQVIIVTNPWGVLPKDEP